MKTGEKPSLASAPISRSDATFEMAYAETGLNAAVSSSGASPAAPYVLHDDANTKRLTPAARASSARRTDPRWLISAGSPGWSSPVGSFDSAARWAKRDHAARRA